MAVVVLELVALVFQRIERLVLDPPTTPPATNQPLHCGSADRQIRHPTETLGDTAVSTKLSMIDEVHQQVSMARVERHLFDPLRFTGRAFGVQMCSRQTVHLALVASLNDCFEQMGMIAWLGTQNIMVAITAQVVDMRRVAGQAIFSDDQLELRVLLFDPRQQPFCRVSFTIVFGLAVPFHNRFDRQRDDFF